MLTPKFLLVSVGFVFETCLTSMASSIWRSVSRASAGGLGVGLLTTRFMNSSNP